MNHVLWALIILVSIVLGIAAFILIAVVLQWALGLVGIAITLTQSAGILIVLTIIRWMLK